MLLRKMPTKTSGPRETYMIVVIMLKIVLFTMLVIRNYHVNSKTNVADYQWVVLLASGVRCTVISWIMGRIIKHVRGLRKMS